MPIAKPQIGRRGRVFVAQEDTYGVMETLAPTDAVRHLNVGFQFNPFNRVKSPERKRHASLINKFDRRMTAGFSLSGILYPSGTLNTAPEIGKLLKGAMGVEQNITLNTTVSAAPAPTVSSATLASAAGLAKKQVVQINIAAGPYKGRYARFLTDVTGAAIQWAPPLPVAPATGDVVKGGTTYQLATVDEPSSFCAGHYLKQTARAVTGIVLDRMKIMLDANDEIRFEFSGPAREQLARADVPAEPAGFVALGQNPPSGIKGHVWIDDEPHDSLKAEIEVVNGYVLHNENYGTDRAAAAYAKEDRSVSVSLDTRVSDDVSLYDKTTAGQDAGFFVQTGGPVEGKVVAVYCPVVDFVTPDTGDDDAENAWSYKGDAKGIVGDDELMIGIV